MLTQYSCPSYVASHKARFSVLLPLFINHILFKFFFFLKDDYLSWNVPNSCFQDIALLSGKNSAQRSCALQCFADVIFLSENKSNLIQFFLNVKSVCSVIKMTNAAHPDITIPPSTNHTPPRSNWMSDVVPSFTHNR